MRVDFPVKRRVFFCINFLPSKKGQTWIFSHNLKILSGENVVAFLENSECGSWKGS